MRPEGLNRPLQLDPGRLNVFAEELLNLLRDVVDSNGSIEPVIVMRLADEHERLVGKLAPKESGLLLACEEIRLVSRSFLGVARQVVLRRRHGKPPRKEIVPRKAICNVDDLADVPHVLHCRCHQYLGDDDHPNLLANCRHRREARQTSILPARTAMVYSHSMNRLAEWMRHRDRVLVMGVLNVTPDSFHDGGRYASAKAALERALQMEADGADMLDIGGESTRPGAEPLPSEEETNRILPVIEAIRKHSAIPLSVDTTKSEVAREALAAGAWMVNDISALRFDERMGVTIANTNAFVVLMHMKGTPASMQQDPTYEDVVEEVRRFLDDRIHAATGAGIAPDHILIDPGIGFGKRLHHNLSLLRGLRRLVDLGVPVVIGTSRKSFLGKILDLPSDERLEGTIAANAIAIANGANIIRVHDVKEGRRTADVAFRLRRDDV